MMKPIAVILALSMISVALFAQDDGEGDGFDVRFVAIHLFIDTRDVPLAAYQLSFRATRGDVSIVGIGNGDSAPFNQPPYFDKQAMQHDRVIIGDFSLNESDALPAGRIRIATIHVRIAGDVEPEYELILDAAATVDGEAIDAKATFTQQEDQQQ